MTKLTFFPLEIWRLWARFIPKKFPFYIPMAALFLFFGRQLTKIGYQKKSPEIW
jgi:hypothetical protein